MKKYKLGIALGGGGTRAFCHLGVLQALKEEGIEADIISGTSAGSIVGALIAAGNTPQAVHDLMKEHSLWSFAKVLVPTVGIMSLDKMGEELDKILKLSLIEDLKKPLIIAATNLNTGQITYFEKGPLVKSIQASSSIPVLFSPVDMEDGYCYVDGGLLDNLPVRPLYNYCENIIAINLTPIQEINKFDGLIDIALRSFEIGIRVDKNHPAFEHCYIIEPKDLDKYDLLNAEKADELFEIGYETADTYIEEIKKFLKK